jgi:hypothetical protein
VPPVPGILAGAGPGGPRIVTVAELVLLLGSSPGVSVVKTATLSTWPGVASARILVEMRMVTSPPGSIVPITACTCCPLTSTVPCDVLAPVISKALGTESFTSTLVAGMELLLRTRIVNVTLSPGKPEEGSADLSTRGSPDGGSVAVGVSVGVGIGVGVSLLPGGGFLGVAVGPPGVDVGVVPGTLVEVGVDGVPGVCVSVGRAGVGVAVGGRGVAVPVRSRCGARLGAAPLGSGATTIQIASIKPPINHHTLRGICIPFQLVPARAPVKNPDPRRDTK